MTQPSVSLAALLDVARQMPPLIAADWLRDQPHGMAELCALHILARHYLPPDKCTHRWLDNDAYACVELRDHCITYYLVKDGMVERLDLSTDYTSPTFPLPRILSWRGSHIRGWDRSQDKSDHLNVVYYERLWEWVASDFEDWDMREPVVSPELAM